MPAAVPKDADSAGARLARARARLGLSVDEVAEQLKLDPHTVVALEAGDFRSIGATVFVRGFLRRYAALVGEPAADIEALYSSLPGAESQPDLSRTGMHRIAPPRIRRRIGTVPALIAALVLVIAAAAWWAMRSRPAPLPQAASVVAIPAAPPAPIRTGQGSPVGAPGEPAATPAADTPWPATTIRRRVRLSFSGECWAELYDARGVRLFFGFGHAGTSQEFTGTPPFRAVLANVEAVSVALEGAPVQLPASAPGERVRISLAANGSVTARR
jgi:cytoskeleton protein RodZ